MLGRGTVVNPFSILSVPSFYCCGLSPRLYASTEPPELSAPVRSVAVHHSTVHANNDERGHELDRRDPCGWKRVCFHTI